MGFFKKLSVEERQKRRGMFRAAGYLAVLGGVFGVIQVRQARAEVGDKTISVGRQMFALANATQHDVNRLTINGQQLFIGSSTTDDAVSRVMDRYENLCREKAAQAPEDWKNLAKTDPKNDPGGNMGQGGGVMRTGDSQEGAILCFTKTANSKPSLTEAVSAFASTGELSTVGSVRYVYVKHGDKGTSVLTAWTDEQFNVKSFVGGGESAGKEDAPGADFEGVPRPDGAVRVLSGRVEDTPFGLNVYKGKGEPSAIMAGFDKALVAEDWLALDPQLEEQLQTKDDPKHPSGRLYEKDGNVLTVASHIEAGATFTTMGLAGATAGSDTGINHKKVLFPKNNGPLVPGGPKTEQQH